MKTTRPKKHNKSNDYQLSILKYSDDDLNIYAKNIKESCSSISGLIQDSPCLLMKAKDGRFTKDRIKIGYGYQIIAFKKFGRDELSKIAPSKNQNDLVISHL